MLKQFHQLMLGLLVAADAAAVALAWLASYYLRFRLLPVSPEKGTPGLVDNFLPMLPLVVLAHLAIFYRVGLYQPRRVNSIIAELRDIIKAFFVAVIAVVVIDYAMPASNKISRQFILTYAVLGTTSFALCRIGVRIFLRALRRRGYNQRTAAIVGSGRSAQRLYDALSRHTWTGLRVSYFVDDRQRSAAGLLRNAPVYGPLAGFAKTLELHPVDVVFIALPADQTHRVEELLAALECHTADVRLIPELNPAYALRPDVGELDGVPIVSLRQTPLYGWNALTKRGFDLIVGSICLAIAAPAMLVIAAAIKLTSPGPVFFRQRRVGLDGREFLLVKFRTMRVEAEQQAGISWAPHGDQWRTPIGTFLRRTSLDELPNLLNVLSGQMSLVGPRPERPEFIRQFTAEIPRYMLRHKIKAGMTGFAQIRGLRGDTDLRRRIQHDVHYIRHWSLWLDARILLQTVFGIWFSRHQV